MPVRRVLINIHYEKAASETFVLRCREKTEEINSEYIPGFQQFQQFLIVMVGKAGFEIQYHHSTALS